MLQTENNITIENLKHNYVDLTVYFQPIFSAKDSKLFGYEALTRHISQDINIKELFNKAKKDGSIFLLDMICRLNALSNAYLQQIKTYLFINICPETLLCPQHSFGLTERFAEEFNIPKEKIVLEITEETAVENYDVFLKSIFYYKDQGFKIAIDDFGVGFGGPKMLSLIKPDIVKIDRYFISNVESCNICKTFIEFTVSLSHDEGIMVVAEGIENQSQLNEVLSAGVDLLQGFYLGKPLAKVNHGYESIQSM